jgi:hypothetical protein
MKIPHPHIMPTPLGDSPRAAEQEGFIEDRRQKLRAG